MDVMERIDGVAREIVKQGLAHARDVEVRIVQGDSYAYELHGRELAPQIALGRVQVGLRALVPEGVALAATTSLDVEENVEALKVALGSARPTPLSTFGSLELGPDGRGHDPAWDAWAAEPALLRDLAANLRDGLYGPHGDDPRLEAVEGSVSFGTSWTALASRTGHAIFKRSAGGAYVQVNGAHHEVVHLDRAPGRRDLEALSRLGARVFEAVPERVATPEDLGLHGGDEVTAVLHPRLLEAVLRSAGQEKFLGSSRRTGLTTFEPGDRLWDPKITLWDTALEPGLSTTRPCDDELTATRSTPLVKDGRFQSLVWSRRSALEGGGESTGNGYRTPMLVEEPNEAPVRDRLSGLVMAPGESGSLEDLLAPVERGIYVLSCLGLHGADKARAAFSATVYDGFAVEDGRIVAFLAPGRWNVAAHLFPEGGEAGLLGQVALTAHRHVTGSARLPWIRTRLRV